MTTESPAIFRPTDEQQAIIDAARCGWSGKVIAFAGTGKTTTAREIIRSFPDSTRVLYLVFNKRMSDEAKRRFADITCRLDVKTFHGLAYQHMMPDPTRFRNRPSGAWLAERLGIVGMRSPVFSWTPRGEPRRGEGGTRDPNVMAGSRIALYALETLERWAQDDEPEIQLSHVPSARTILLRGQRIDWDLMPPDVRNEFERIQASEDIVSLRHRIFDAAGRIRDIMASDDPEFPLSHSFYFKEFCNLNPRLDYDVIICDEAQDMDDAQIKLVLGQEHASKFWLGDPYQQIYEWRGARSAFTRVEGDEMYLTESFRFPGHIAEVGSSVLRLLGEERPLRGLAERDEEEARNGDLAILCRTNGTVLQRALRCIAEGVPFVLDRAVAADLKALVNDIVVLISGKGSPHGPLRYFPSYGDLKEYVSSSVGGDLGVVVDMVETMDADSMRAIIDSSLRRKRKGAVALTTIHQAKGREWSRVIVDWPARRKATRWPAEDIRLAYVAVTRARQDLDCSSFAHCFDDMPLLRLGRDDFDDDPADDILADLDDPEMDTDKSSFRDGVRLR